VGRISQRVVDPSDVSDVAYRRVASDAVESVLPTQQRPGLAMASLL
jgi:hypothetical protein